MNFVVKGAAGASRQRLRPLLLATVAIILGAAGSGLAWAGCGDGWAFPLFAMLGAATARLPRSPGEDSNQHLPALLSMHPLADGSLQYQAQAIGQYGNYQARVCPLGTGRYETWSPEMYRVLACDPECSPKTIEDYVLRWVHPEDRDNLKRVWCEAIAAASSAAAEYRTIGANGEQKYVFDYIECKRDEASGSILVSGLLFDVTDRKRVESERLEAAARYQELVERMGGIPYVSNPDAEASTIHVSGRIRELLGFSPEEWCGDPGLRLRQVHVDDRRALRDAIALTLATGLPLNIDYRIHTATGSLRWVHDEARLVRSASGVPLFVQGVLFDISRFKNAQEELERSHRELKSLIVALDAMREEEQRRLAREMHDDLGQLLAAMKIDLNGLERALPEDERATHLSRLHGLVDTMLCSVRRIIADLPPKDLEELGLLPALAQMCKTFSARYSLPCELRFPPQAPALALAGATAIYRLVQEALSNVARHAAATRVAVQVEVFESRLKVSVADNGKGMHNADEGRSGSFGLIGMRERVAALGGQLHIAARRGGGTVVSAEIPLG